MKDAPSLPVACFSCAATFCARHFATATPTQLYHHAISGVAIPNASSPYGPTRDMVVYPVDSRPLPGLSSLLHHQRDPHEACLRSSSSPWHLGRRVTNRRGTSGPDLDPLTHHSLRYRPTRLTQPLADGGETAAATVPKKASRYLRELDRRTILSRIAQGEKQSVLATEYHVSRAAICNLYKHREKVLSRKDGNPLAKHPKTPRGQTGHVCPNKPDGRRHQREPGARPRVYAIQSRAVVVLWTRLRHPQATRSEFRRSSDRLMRLVMEEALASVPLKAVEILLSNQCKADGVALEHPPCAISMEPTGRPMLNLFHLIEPDQPTGYVRFRAAFGPHRGTTTHVHLGHAQVCGTRLPPSLNYHNVFILSPIVTSAEVILAVVRRLHEHGAVVPMMALVALVATPEVVDQVHGTFPALKIVVAQVDDGQSPTIDTILDRMEQVYHRPSQTDRLDWHAS